MGLPVAARSRHCPNLGWMCRVEQYTIASLVDVTALAAPDPALGAALAGRHQQATTGGSDGPQRLQHVDAPCSRAALDQRDPQEDRVQQRRLALFRRV